MKKIVIAILLIASLKAHSQSCGSATKLVDTLLIADETTMTLTKTEAHIQCDNETVFNEIFKTHGTLFKRFTCTWKTDRHRRYKHYVIYLNKDDASFIISWADKTYKKL